MSQLFNFKNLRLVPRDSTAAAHAVRATRSNTTFATSGTVSEQIQQIEQQAQEQAAVEASVSQSPDKSDDSSTDNSIEVILPDHPEDLESLPDATNDTNINGANSDSQETEHLYPDLAELVEDRSVPPPPVTRPCSSSSQVTPAVTSPASETADNAPSPDAVTFPQPPDNCLVPSAHVSSRDWKSVV